MLQIPRSIRGVVGQIRWSYYVAGAINDYVVWRAKGVWQLQATVVQADAFKLAQRPLTFVAPTKAGAWRWPIQVLQVADGCQLELPSGPFPIRARLGPPLTGGGLSDVTLR